MKNNLISLLKLTFPLALTGLVQSSAWFFETVFLSHLSPEILAAGSLVSWSFGTVIVILFGTLSSINILIAHKYGAQDEQGIYLLVRDGFWLAVSIAIPIFIIFWNMSPLFLLLGQKPAVVLLAKAYLHAMAWGILANVIMIALLEVFMGLGRARVILFFNILSVVLTIFFSFTLIFGKFGFPMLGIAGAGWGLTISNTLSALAMGLYVYRSKKYKHYFSFILNFNKPLYYLELLYIGIPIGLMYAVEVAFFFALTLLMGTFGSLILAANQISLQYLGSLMAIIFSTSQAITIRMGHLLGAKDKDSAKQTAYMGICISITLMSMIAIVYWNLPTLLISIDFNIYNPENQKIVFFASQFLKICAIFQIFEAIRISLFGALRALKDTRFTLIISILSFWGIALPLGYFIATQGDFGPAGLWWGMVIAACLSVILLFLRFRYKIRGY